MTTIAEPYDDLASIQLLLKERQEARRFYQLRVARSVTQEQLAVALGVSRVQVGRLEVGMRKPGMRTWSRFMALEALVYGGASEGKELPLRETILVETLQEMAQRYPKSWPRFLKRLQTWTREELRAVKQAAKPGKHHKKIQQGPGAATVWPKSSRRQQDNGVKTSASG